MAKITLKIFSEFIQITYDYVIYNFGFSYIFYMLV